MIIFHLSDEVGTNSKFLMNVEYLSACHFISFTMDIVVYSDIVIVVNITQLVS